MKCTIEIDMGNAAFEDEWELARILTELAERTKAGWIPERYEAKPYLYERENEYPIYWIVNYGLKRECISNGREE